MHLPSAKIKNLWNWRFASQIGFLLLLVIFATITWKNLSSNLQRLGITLDFNFLNSQASFNIREAPIAFQSTDTYARALVVGLLNTFKVMAIAIVSATVVGISVGVARLSQNWLLRQIATVYVESLRNIPLLLQLFFWYAAIFLALPPAPGSIGLWGIASLNNEGVTIPLIQTNLSSEFCALVIGLSLYSASFIAEIVRGGILAISKGQWEAARALGLKPGKILQLIVFPQALRVIIPPLTSQYLNIAKNSSLAIAVGYEDVYAVSSTTFNQTGKPVQIVLLLMVTYLTISLIVSLVMNLLNRRFQIQER
ncbi:MAG: ABC transporter permease subunit [Pseudanabaena sp. CRU_2_10]|nr:ABC transporter permease subunit [Pseudanabaena sp. CRU_2_10]